MNRRFVHYFKIVAAVHVGVIITLAVFSGCSKFLEKKKEVPIAVKFMVAVPPSANEAVSVKEAVAPEIPKEKKAKPVPRKPKPPKKKLKSVSDVDISRKKIVRSSNKKPKEYLSQEEIKKLLMQGAEAGDQNILPSEEARCLARVRKVLYDSWSQPTAEEAGGVVAEVKIRLLLNGRIAERRLIKKSGIKVLDDSVMRAVNSVSVITGLTPAFIKKHESITISFKVQ